MSKTFISSQRFYAGNRKFRNDNSMQKKKREKSIKGSFYQ